MFINLNGKNIYAEFKNDFKDRPTIVFLHDSLGCVELWRDFPQKITDSVQCNLLVYDRLGYGKSDPMSSDNRTNEYLTLEAETLNHLLEILEINEAVLFGHSDGGSIALIAASKFKQRIKMIICEAAHIFVESITLKGIYNAIEAYKNTNLPERLYKYHGDKTQILFKAWAETWTTNDFKSWNIENLLSKIICPVLFIQGDMDEYGTIEQVNRTVDLVNGKSEKFIIPNVHHTPHKEVPDLVLQKTIEFILCELKW